MRRVRTLATALAIVAGCASRSTKDSAPPATAAEPPDVAAPSAQATRASTADVSIEPTYPTPAQLARDAELAQRAAAIVDAFQNRIQSTLPILSQVFGFGGVLTHDRKKIVFGSDRAGSPQLYLGDIASPAAPPRRLTMGPERVQTATLTRDGKWVLFTRDRGADENSHIYRLALDGSGPVDLTPGEKIRNDPPVLPLRKRDVMVFGKRTVTSAASRIVVQPIAGGEPRTVYEDAVPAYAIDAAPDASSALVVRLVSPSEQVLLAIDLVTGSARRLWPSEGRRATVTAAAYAPDGRTVYVATDQGGETTALFALDARSRAVKARWTPDPPTATVGAIAVSSRGEVVALYVDAGNRGFVRLVDARTLKERARPEVPLGSGELGKFTPDGRALTFTLSTPDHPGDQYAIDVQSGKVRALRADPRPQLEAIAKLVTTVSSVPAFDGKPIPVHYYVPRNRRSSRLPVIVEFHGGPPASYAVGWRPRAEFFLSLGYAWVEPNVRGSTGFGRAWEMADNRERRGDVLKDMASVNAWVKAQPWADPERIVIFGGSYGGWVVLEGLTRQQALWSAGVDAVGVADLRMLLRTTDQGIRAAFVEEFGDLDHDDALLAEWSPLKDADRITAPLFVYQGQNDPRVPRSEADAIVKALRARGSPVEYMVAPNEGHSFDRRETQIELYSRVARFLEEHLTPRA